MPGGIQPGGGAKALFGSAGGGVERPVPEQPVSAWASGVAAGGVPVVTEPGSASGRRPARRGLNALFGFPDGVGAAGTGVGTGCGAAVGSGAADGGADGGATGVVVTGAGGGTGAETGG